MATSILEYLAGLRRYGHIPQMIGEATIGKTVYAVGSWRDADTGNTPLVFIPVHTAGRTEDLPLLPASFRRSSNTAYDCGPFFGVGFIAGWSDTEGVFWVHAAPESLIEGCRVMTCTLRFEQGFSGALAMAGDEVLARIEAAEKAAREEVK